MKIVGVGYNGFPIGCSDDSLPWSKSAQDRLETKYPYVCHAELNAIINKNSRLFLGEKISISHADSLMYRHCVTSCHFSLHLFSSFLPIYFSDVRGCVMYVTLFPCNECAKLAIQAGISKIIYLSDKHHDKPEMIASRKLFDMVMWSIRLFYPTYFLLFSSVS